jgi:nickel-dependent lactate racemase
MQIITLPWQKWLNEGEKKITFPNEWDLQIADEILRVPELDSSGIQRAFQYPFSTPSIAKMARNRRNAVIAIDDVTRPTPTHRLLPLVLKELEFGGISRGNIRVIVASGAHKASARQELANKIGKDILDSVDFVYHVPYENLVDLGSSIHGTPILTNRDFYEGDLKIAIGSIMPHPNAGFGGGRKIVSVGLSAASTLREFHKRDTGWLRTGCISDNVQHDDLEDIMHKVGLDIVVDAVLTGRGGIADLFVGEPTQCFLLGINKAWQLYATAMPQGADIVVLNAYPKDYDLIQACNSLWVTLYPNMNIVRPGGTVVCMSACPDGAGLHYLSSHGMSDLTWFEESSFKGRRIMWFSDNLSEFELHRHFPESVCMFREWENVLSELQKYHTADVKVVIYPCAPLHLNPSNRGRGAIPV